VVGLLAVGLGYAALTLQSPSDDATRGNGAARINDDTVLLTVKFTDFDDGGPHTVAVAWDARMGMLGPVLDSGDDTASISPYTHTIRTARGAKVTAAAHPATREGSYQPFWRTECWLHRGGVLLPGGRSHDGPNPGSQGCAVSGTVT
jgi:hypothetical protein